MRRDRRKIPRYNGVCRIIHPRNDRFLFFFFSLPTRRIYNFAIFSCPANHRSDLFIPLFVYLFIYFFPPSPTFQASVVVIQFVTQTEVLITSFRLICTLRGEQKFCRGGRTMACWWPPSIFVILFRNSLPLMSRFSFLLPRIDN